MDKIFLTALTTETVIGIFDWEREVKQAISIDLEMAPGTSEARTAEVAQQIERDAMACPEVTSVFAVHGAGMSDMGAMAVTDPATVAQLVVELEESETRERKGGRKSRDVVAQLRAGTATIPAYRHPRNAAT